jgi:hypothetical protein
MLVLGISRLVRWLSMCVSVVWSIDSVNTLLLGVVAKFLVRSRHMQQL